MRQCIQEPQTDGLKLFYNIKRLITLKGFSKRNPPATLLTRSLTSKFFKQGGKEKQ